MTCSINKPTNPPTGCMLLAMTGHIYLVGKGKTFLKGLHHIWQPMSTKKVVYLSRYNWFDYLSEPNCESVVIVNYVYVCLHYITLHSRWTAENCFLEWRSIIPSDIIGAHVNHIYHEKYHMKVYCSETISFYSLKKSPQGIWTSPILGSRQTNKRSMCWHIYLQKYHTLYSVG